MRNTTSIFRCKKVVICSTEMIKEIVLYCQQLNIHFRFSQFTARTKIEVIYKVILSWLEKRIPVNLLNPACHHWCVYLLDNIKRSPWWWQWDTERRRWWALGAEVVRVTSRLASNTLGTMWGRQRPSISITLSSLSAIRDTCNERCYCNILCHQCIDLMTVLQSMWADLCPKAAIGAHSAEGQQSLLKGWG